MMTYKSYSAKVTFDPDAGAFHGEVIGLRDVITFQATSVDGLWTEFRDSVDDYLAWCEELGQEPEKAYSGKCLVRMDAELHRDLALAAEREGTSINSLAVACISEGLRQRKGLSMRRAPAAAVPSR